MKPSAPDHSLPLCSLKRRLAALTYDTLLLLGVLFFASIPFTLATRITYDSPWYIAYVGYLTGLTGLFFTWFWTRGGQTLGMKTWQITLRTETGAAVDGRRAILRFALAILPWIPLGVADWIHAAPRSNWVDALLWAPPVIAWALAIANRERITWYDQLSGTRLVHIGRATPSSAG